MRFFDSRRLYLVRFHDAAGLRPGICNVYYNGLGYLEKFSSPFFEIMMGLLHWLSNLSTLSL